MTKTPHHNPHRCADYGVLLSKHYEWEYCPKHWRQRYHAPPGYNRIEHLQAAANPAALAPLYQYPGNFFGGSSAIAAQEEL